MEMIKDLGWKYLHSKSRDRTHRAIYMCPRCKEEFETSVDAVKRTNIQSCKGCSHITHGKAKTSNKTPLYNVWKSIKQRCNNSNNKAYKNYGAKGVKRCNEWNTFIVFEKWALENGWKKGLNISRKGDIGDYEPNNCGIKTKSENTIEGNRKRKGVKYNTTTRI